MGNDVTLVLKGQNTDLINKMKEVQREQQKIYDGANAGEKREKGILQEIEDRLTALGKKRKEAFSYEEIAKYNKKIEETKQNLKEYEEAGLKADKSTGSLTQSIGKWALSLGGAAAIIRVLKDAVMKLTPAINAFNIIGAVTEKVLYNIVTGTTNWTDGIKEAIKTQQKLNDLRTSEYKESYEVQKLETEFQRKWNESLSAELSTKEKISVIDEALAAHNKAIDIQMEHALKTRDAMLEKLQQGQGSEENYKAFWESMKKIEALDAERFESTKRLTRQRATLEKQDHDDAIKRWYDEIEAKAKADEEANKARLDEQKKYQDLSLKLLDDYDKSNIESLSGVAKLKAIRDFGLKQIAEFRKQLAELGTVTEEQDAIFAVMGQNVWKAFIKGMEKEARVSPEQKTAISKALLAGIPSMDELRKPITNLTVGRKPISSIWELIGIDPEGEEGKKAIESIKKGAETAMKALNDVMQRRVEDAQRNRELLDTKISEAEEELNTETELYKAGYASNVDAKRKEIAALKVQRDAALKQEQDAVKKQRALDTITQVSSLITASADIFKSLAKIPIVGVPLAIGVIATMFGAFAAAKANANKVAFEKGGMVGGKQHSQGGTIIEAEEGEYVVNRKSTSKFREVIEALNKDDKRLAFNKFTKISPEFKGSTINNVTVENDGPNKRLDTLITLNKRRSKEEITELADQTIIRKGNSTRIVRK